MAPHPFDLIHEVCWMGFIQGDEFPSPKEWYVSTPTKKHANERSIPPCNLHDDGIMGFLLWFLGSPNLGLEWWLETNRQVCPQPFRVVKLGCSPVYWYIHLMFILILMFLDDEPPGSPAFFCDFESHTFLFGISRSGQAVDIATIHVVSVLLSLKKVA